MNPQEQADRRIWVLFLEDSERDYELILEHLTGSGFFVSGIRVEKQSDFKTAIQTSQFDIILADFNLPDFNAFHALQICRLLCPEIPFICISGYIGEETAVELIKQGAVDYLFKDRLKRLPAAIHQALDHAREKSLIRFAEEQLRESELNFRTLADSGQALIWTSGTEKSCNYFNRVWLNFTGRTLEQEMGDGWLEGVHPDDLSHCLNTYTNSFDQRIPFSMEYRLRRYDGEYRWLIDDGCPRYDSQGEFTGYIGHCLDITERKLAEAEIIELNSTLERKVEERTAQLVSANQEMEAFSYTVSHDLRAPLRAINGFVQILVDDYAGRLDDEGIRLCGIIKDGTLKMSTLIENLLDFSRVGRCEMKRAEVNMSEMVWSIYHNITDEDSRKRINLKIGDLGNIHADEDLLQHVWTNLISNAIKFSSKEAVSEITIDADKKNGKRIFCIRDNGAGFNMQHKDRLFKVFERLHSAHDFKGSGAGLAIVQRIVHRHGGEVWAEGTPGKGAVFCFSLPH
jgi:PAS domain S-box-containing protein